MAAKTMNLNYRGKAFQVAENVGAKGTTYDVTYDGVMLRKGLPDLQRAVNAARNFIDKFAGLPEKEKKVVEKKA